MPTYLWIATVIVLVDAFIIFLGYRKAEQGRRRERERQLRAIKHFDTDGGAKAWEVMGGHAGPEIEQPEGRTRVGL
jgi:hypothetical protein